MADEEEPNLSLPNQPASQPINQPGRSNKKGHLPSQWKRKPDMVFIHFPVQHVLQKRQSFYD